MSRANKQTSVDGEEGGNLPGTRNICGASQAPRILGHGIGCPWGIRTTTPPKTARREQQSVKAGLVCFSMSWEFGCDYVVWPHPKPEQPGILKKVSMTEMPPCAPPVVFLHPKNMIQKQLYNSFTSHHKAIMSLPAPWRTSGPPAVPWHFPSPPSHVGEPSSGPSYTAPAAPRGQPSHARPRPAGNRDRGPSTARRTGSRWRRRRRVFAGARLVEMVRGCGHRILVRAP